MQFIDLKGTSRQARRDKWTNAVSRQSKRIFAVPNYAVKRDEQLPVKSGPST